MGLFLVQTYLNAAVLLALRKHLGNRRGDSRFALHTTFLLIVVKRAAGGTKLHIFNNIYLLICNIVYTIIVQTICSVFVENVFLKNFGKEKFLNLPKRDKNV